MNIIYKFYGLHPKIFKTNIVKFNVFGTDIL